MSFFVVVAASCLAATSSSNAPINFDSVSDRLRADATCTEGMHDSKVLHGPLLTVRLCCMCHHLPDAHKLMAGMIYRLALMQPIQSHRNMEELIEKVEQQNGHGQIL